MRSGSINRAGFDFMSTLMSLTFIEKKKKKMDNNSFIVK